MLCFSNAMIEASISLLLGHRFLGNAPHFGGKSSWLVQKDKMGRMLEPNNLLRGRSDFVEQSNGAWCWIGVVESTREKVDWNLQSRHVFKDRAGDDVVSQFTGGKIHASLNVEHVLKGVLR